MSITKPSIVTKSDFTISDLPIANKVTASDVNEFHRALDDTIDVVNQYGTQYSGGIFAHFGGQPAQSVAPLARVQIDQWTGLEAGDNIGTEVGDDVLIIPADAGGIYLVTMDLNYSTDAQGGDIFRWCVTKNGSDVPGLCVRIPHERNGASSYAVSATLMISLEVGDELAVVCEGFDLSTTREFTLLNGALTIWRRINGVTP